MHPFESELCSFAGHLPKISVQRVWGALLRAHAVRPRALVHLLACFESFA
jgi:hypothetical protein